MSETRLERLETKIDDLQEAVVSLARVEERIVTIFNRQSEIEKRVNNMDEHLQKIRPTILFGERIFWMVMVAAVSAFTGYFA